MSDDPYVILGIAPDADDTVIRAAFHARVRAGVADAAVNGAYAAIRDPAARARRRWIEPTALIAPLPDDAAPTLDLATLAGELAFLSDWELGEPIDG